MRDWVGFGYGERDGLTAYTPSYPGVSVEATGRFLSAADERPGMGFGSYDESEQREPEFDADESDEEDVDLHKHDHEGTASFESGASTDDLVDRLAGIKEDAEEE